MWKPPPCSGIDLLHSFWPGDARKQESLVEGCWGLLFVFLLLLSLVGRAPGCLFSSASLNRIMVGGGFSFCGAVSPLPSLSGHCGVAPWVSQNRCQWCHASSVIKEQLQQKELPAFEVRGRCWVYAPSSLWPLHASVGQ